MRGKIGSHSQKIQKNFIRLMVTIRASLLEFKMVNNTSWSHQMKWWATLGWLRQKFQELFQVIHWFGLNKLPKSWEECSMRHCPKKSLRLLQDNTQRYSKVSIRTKMTQPAGVVKTKKNQACLCSQKLRAIKTFTGYFTNYNLYLTTFSRTSPYKKQFKVSPYLWRFSSFR